MKQALWVGIALVIMNLSSRVCSAQESSPEPVVVPAPAPTSAPELESTAPSAASTAPAATAPAAVPEAPPAGAFKLHVRANQPGVAFHYSKVAYKYDKRTRANAEIAPQEWTRLCLEECDFSLPAGSYRLALSYGAAEPVMAPTTLNVASDLKLDGAYSDRSQRRLAGWLILGLGGVASAANIAFGAGIASQVSGGDELGNATIIGGLVGLALSLAVGIPLAASGDRSSVDPRK